MIDKINICNSLTINFQEVNKITGIDNRNFGRCRYLLTNKKMYVKVHGDDEWVIHIFKASEIKTIKYT